MDLFSCWYRRLNFSHSKMSFFCTCKNSLNLVRTDVCFFISSSLIVVEATTSSASSPRQYSNVLTCLASLSFAISEEIQNCSKRFFYFGQLSGCLKSKRLGGFSCKQAVAIPPLPPCRSSTFRLKRQLLLSMFHTNTQLTVQYAYTQYMDTTQWLYQNRL